jgi:hypothetical protein
VAKVTRKKIKRRRQEYKRVKYQSKNCRCERCGAKTWYLIASYTDDPDGPPEMICWENCCMEDIAVRQREMRESALAAKKKAAKKKKKIVVKGKPKKKVKVKVKR